MGDVKAYILSVCAAALLCALAGRFINRKHALGGIGRMILGLFLLLVILKPASSLYFDELQYIYHDVKADASLAVERGENLTRDSLAGIIKERTATYILQKANSLQLDITVDVRLSNDAIPIPEEVFISGNAAPYARRQLQNCIEQDLGISKENQIWT